MSTNTTEHLGLSQWLPTDPVLREDFNRDNAALDAACAAIPLMAVGSYTGDGSSGSSAPTSLTFDFCPQLILISPDSRTTLRSGAIFVRGQTKFNGLGFFSTSTEGLQLSLTWGDNSVSWYGGSPEEQFNGPGTAYSYFALGTRI